MVTVIVGGRPVKVPAHTNATQLRQAAHVDHSRVLARSGGGHNRIVSGSIDVREGDTFIVGRSFTKGHMIRNAQKFKVLSSKKSRKSDKGVRIVFPVPCYEQVRASFDVAEKASREGYAIALCGYRSDGSKKSCTYLVKSVHVPERDDLFEQSSITVTPKAEFMEKVLSEASEDHSAILEIHSHVDSAKPNFSWTDIENGMENGRFLKSCGLRFAMVVLGTAGFALSEYESDGDAMKAPAWAGMSLITRTGFREVLAPAVPKSIGDLRVAIVGLNDVGSRIAHKLAGLGFQKFILFDDRLVDAREPRLSAKDIGKRRTKAVHRSLKKIATDLEVAHINHPVSVKKEELKGCDVIFGCADGYEDRLAMNEMSLKYFLPNIEIRVDHTHRDGEVRVIVPSINGCLGCHCGVSPMCNITSSDDLADFENLVASMAVQEFVDMLGGDGQKRFDRIKYSYADQCIDLDRLDRDEHCPLCGKGGILGAGDDKKLRR